MDARLMWDAVMEEQSELFARTLPNAVQTDKEKVSGGAPKNSFDEYLIQKEKLHIEERLKEAEEMIDRISGFLDKKEKELRASKNLHDRIYVMRCIEHSRVQTIARKIGYSESQIYRILEIIAENVKDAKKCEESCDIK